MSIVLAAGQQGPGDARQFCWQSPLPFCCVEHAAPVAAPSARIPRCRTSRETTTKSPKSRRLAIPTNDAADAAFVSEIFRVVEQASSKGGLLPNLSCRNRTRVSRTPKTAIQTNARTSGEKRIADCKAAHRFPVDAYLKFFEKSAVHWLFIRPFEPKLSVVRAHLEKNKTGKSRPLFSLLFWSSC